MDRPLTLAHLSDIHLQLPSGCRTGLRAKRLLGLLNWRARRSRQHLEPTLRSIVADMQAQRPDHIVVTGDLANLGLPIEHAAASRWLAMLGPPAHVTAIPGNHDIYGEDLAASGVGRWLDFMFGDGDSDTKEVSFPFVRRLGRIALIGLNSAVPTPLFQAYGRLGLDQLDRLAKVLARLGDENCVRVVLIHHPPLPKSASRSRALQDSEGLADVLARNGAELVLHGHNHRAMTAFATGPSRPIPVIGVPSASLGVERGGQMLARYNLYRISPDPVAPIHLIERGLAAAGSKVVELRRLALSQPGWQVA